MQPSTSIEAPVFLPTQQNTDWQVQSIVSAPVLELFALPVFAILLVLVLKGSQRLSSALYSCLYNQYQMYRLAVRLRQIDMLERIFTTSPSSSEQG